MLRMANLAYASVWCRDFSESTLLERFGAFLETVAFSTTCPGFSNLLIRAVDPTEAPVFDQDLRPTPLDAAGILELASEYLHSDSAYETCAYWDLWVYDATTSGWKLEPQPLEILCHGEEYDDGAWRMNGHLQAAIGFEHLFTGHARVLGSRRGLAAPPQHPAEENFLTAMARPEKLDEYHEKTRANIRKLFDWLQRIERHLPVEKTRLWSEGEENFEARLEEILAVH